MVGFTAVLIGVLISGEDGGENGYMIAVQTARFHRVVAANCDLNDNALRL